MWYSIVVVTLFAILAALCVWPRMQRILLCFTHRLLQLLVAILAIAAAVFTVRPDAVPVEFANWLVASGWADAVTVEQTSYWLTRGLGIVCSGLLCLVLLSHLRDLPLVSQHLSDIRKLMGNVSLQVSEARRSSDSQGALRRAVETMHEFFKK